jgi:hypothetical protein
MNCWFGEVSEIKLDAMPVKLIYSGSKILGTLGVFFGGSFVFLPLAAILINLREPDFAWEAAHLFILVPLAFFLPILIWGLGEFAYRKVITIDSSSVSWSLRSLKQSTSFSLPLKDFEGICYVPDIYFLDGDSSCAAHALVLYHRDKDKRVRLLISREKDEIIRPWRHYAEVLRLRAIEEINPNFLMPREVDELERSMMDVLRSGIVRLPIFSAEPPEGLVLEANNAEQLLSLKNGTTIVLEEDSLQIHNKSAFEPEKSIDYETIESIKVHYDTTKKKDAVVIQQRYTDQSKPAFLSKCSFGHGLKLEALAWIQYYLLSSIVNQASSKSL